MTTNLSLAFLKRAALLLLLLLSTLNYQPSTWAQDTASTYQGRLNDGGSSANGSYDLTFALFDASGGGTQSGSPLTNSAVAVTNGLFTVSLDFGSAPFYGSADRWLEIGVRTNGSGGFATLSPRHRVTPTPYAITAGNVIAGGLPSGTYGNALTFNNAANSFNGSYTGNGGGLTNVNASTLGGLSALNFWQLGGNNVTSGQFIGSTNNQALELRVNGTRGLRLEPNTNGAPNVIGGASVNFVAPGVVGATIAGGGATNYFGGPVVNSILADFGSIGGGLANSIQASAVESTIGGGDGNHIQTNAYYSTVGGGYANSIQPDASLSAIAGGGVNTIQTNAYYSMIGGGYQNTIQHDANSSTIGGGIGNSTAAGAAFIGGGSYNTNAGGGAVIGGGFFNRTENFDAVVGGGGFNVNAGYRSAIGGGEGNSIFNSGSYATIGGGAYNTIQTNAFSSTVGGGYGNVISMDAFNSIIGGGFTNVIGTNAPASTIGGGTFNLIAPSTGVATISGGTANYNSGSYGTIGGGAGNSISNTGSYASIGGGYGNLAQGNSSTVGGGGLNSASGQNATVPGGAFNNALGDYSFATGRRAIALHPGAFVWADSTDADFASTSDNQFSIRASGGVRIETSGAGVSVDGLGVLIGSVNASQITDGAVTTAKIADGTIGLSDLSPTVANNTFWRLGGNAGTAPGVNFLGTADNQPLEIKVNGSRALRLEPTANGTPNIIAGSPVNSVSPGVFGVTISGGGNNLADVSTLYATIGGGQINAVHAGGYESTIGGGYRNTIETFDSTIGGGAVNTIQTNSQYSTIAGGTSNRILTGAMLSAIGGGSGNVIESNAQYSAIPGGVLNTAGGQSSFAAGYRAKAMHQGSFVWADSQEADFASTANNQFLIRAAGGVGINKNNPVTALDVNGTVTATSFSGNGAALTSLNAAKLTGSVPGAALTTVPAGNLAGTIADARLSGNVPLLNAGQTFTGVNQFNNLVGIGIAPQSTLHVNGTARIQGANNWDVSNTEGDFRVGNDVQRFKIGVATGGGGAGDIWMRAQGGTARVFIKTPGGTTFYSNEGQSVGVTLAPGDGAWTTVSDRNAKENFAPTNPRDVLEKVAALPIQTWNYKSQDAAIRHMGPMAQDFKAAFAVGASDKGITTVDADGVALAAIQGLNQKVEEKGARISVLEKQNTLLETRLEVLERLLAEMTARTLSQSR